MLVNPYTQKMKSPVLNIPVELLKYVFHEKIRKPFTLLLYLKVNSSGKLHINSNEFIQAMNVLEIDDLRTFKKYINILLHENWIGFNSKSGYWFIRGFRYIRQQHGFNQHRMVQFKSEKDLTDPDAFMFGAVVGDRVLRQKSFRGMMLRKEGGTATRKRGVANQSLPPSRFPDYYSLAFFTMGKILGLSQTRACELKKRAIVSGYLKCNHKFNDIITLKQKDSHIKKKIAIGDPDLAKKIRIFVSIDKGEETFIVKEQVSDEVIPLMLYKSVRLRVKDANKYFHPSQRRINADL